MMTVIIIIDMFVSDASNTVKIITLFLTFVEKDLKFVGDFFSRKNFDFPTNF